MSSASWEHTPDVDVSLKLTIDEITWLHASQTILQSPVREVCEDGVDRSHLTLGTSVSSNPPLARTGSKLPIRLMLRMSQTLPVPTPSPRSNLDVGLSSRYSEDTPSSSAKGGSISATPRLALLAQSRIQSPTLHRNKAWHKNRHYHVEATATKSHPVSSTPSWSPVAPTSPTAGPSFVSSIPLPGSSSPTRPSPARTLPTQRTEWLYRQPKPRAPPSLKVTTIPPPPPASLTATKPASPLPSRIPVRPRTRSSSSRINLKQRSSRSQMGYYSPMVNAIATPAKRPVHSTLPARSALTPKITSPPANNKAFWSTLLSRSKSGAGKPILEPVTLATTDSSTYELLDVGKERLATASSSLSSLLSYDLLQSSPDIETSKEKEAIKPPVSFLRRPSQRSSPMSSPPLPMTTTIAQQNMANFIPATSPLTPKITTNLTITASPPSPTLPSPTPSPRTRSSSSSSNSSTNSSALTHSSSASESTAPSTPILAHFPPSVAVTQTNLPPSPSKSILSRASSMTSTQYQRSVPSTITTFLSSSTCGVSPVTANTTGTGTTSSVSTAKCVTFLDEPTVHYAPVLYTEPECENDGIDETRSCTRIVEEGKWGRQELHGKAGPGKQGLSISGVRGGHSGYRVHLRRDHGADGERTSLDHPIINEEDEECGKATFSYPGSAYSREHPRGPNPGLQMRRQQQQQPPQRSRQRSSMTTLMTPKAADTEAGTGGLKRLISLTRKAGDSPTHPMLKVKGDSRPTISGPFALGSLPAPTSSSPPPSPTLPPMSVSRSPYSRNGRTNSSTTSLRSFLSYTNPARRSNTVSSSRFNSTTRTSHHKSHSYSGRTGFPFLHTNTSSSADITTNSISPCNSNTTTPLRGQGLYSNPLRAAPSLESFKSTAGRSVRSLGSVKSTASTRGFRAWLSKVGEGIGISGPIDDTEDD